MKKMKKVLSCVLALALICSMCVSLFGCGNNFTVEHKTPERIPLSLDYTSIKMVIGDKAYLDIEYEYNANNEFLFQSLNESVAYVQDGYVVANGLGETTISIIYGEEKIELNVNVELGNSVPTLKMNQLPSNNVKVSLLDTINLKPTILFNEKSFDDVLTIYEVEDESIGTVENGIFKPLSAGTTKIYLNSTWKGLNYDDFYQEITVEVCDDVYFYLTNQEIINDITLYTQANVGNNQFQTEVEFIPRVEINGENIDNSNISVYIEDETVVSYNKANNKISSKGIKGSTDITISFGGYSKSLTVDVKQSYADYQGEVVKFSAYDGDIDTVKIFGKKTEIVSAVDENGDELNVVNGKICDEKLMKAQPVERKITIFDKEIGYSIKIIPYTLIINEVSDLAYFTLTSVTKAEFKTGDTAKNITDATEFSGYYILEKDIDASGYEHKVWGELDNYVLSAGFNNNYAQLKGGLTGIFDGNGHTISNLTVYQYGLFGLVTGGTIKNVGFNNVTLKAEVRSNDNSKYTPTGLFAESMHNVTLDNVYVKANTVYGTRNKAIKESDLANASANGDRGLLANRIFTSTISNCLINGNIGNKGAKWHYSYGSLACVDGPTMKKGFGTFKRDWSNVYVISDTILYGFSSNTTVLANTLDFDTVDGITRYEDLSAMQNDKTANEESLNTFSSTYWSIVNGVPIWNSAE